MSDTERTSMSGKRPSAGVRNALAQVLYQHEWNATDDGLGVCDCGWPGDGDHAAHQAEQVIATIRALTARQQDSLIGRP